MNHDAVNIEPHLHIMFKKPGKKSVILLVSSKEVPHPRECQRTLSTNPLKQVFDI